MDQATLVGTQVDLGQRLLDRLGKEGIEVTVAAWVKESDTGEWYLYLGTPLVGEDGATRAAYMRLITTIRQLQQEGVAIDPFDIKVIGPTEPVAKALIAARDRYAGRMPTHIRGGRLGHLAADEGYIYPPLS